MTSSLLSICSGKSSLLLLLLRLLDPIQSEKSHISIDGISLATLNRRTVRERLIAIPQDPLIIEHLTWQENLQPLESSTIVQCENILRDVNLLDAIHNAGGLEASADPDILSHGQRQLFGLARAVLKGRQKNGRAAQSSFVDGGEGGIPRCGGLLLLDEIASSTDESTERAMHDMILKEFCQYTIIAVAHRAGSMTGFDTVVVMEDGEVKEENSAAPTVRDQFE